MIVMGGAAGAVGVWAMDVVTWAMYRRERADLLAREDTARVGGKDTAHAAARRLAQLVGSDAAKRQPNAGGIAIHYLLGIVPGVVYARLRRRRPSVAAAKGAAWGAALFVVNDEVAAPMLGIAGPPQAYPWQAHLRGLVGHVVLAVVTHIVLDALENAHGPRN